MNRRVAMFVHVPMVLVAGVLYFFFVLPRWPELNYQTSHTLGTVLRIVTGVLIGLSALPIVFNWLRARKPEYGTPELALTLRVVAIVLHVLGGVLITGTAISEIWLSLDQAGRWLFGIYGAAAAITLLGIAAFQLAFVAELPPPPPRPLKTKPAKQKRRTRPGKKDKAADDKAGKETADEKAGKETADEKAGKEADEKSSDDGGGETEDAAAPDKKPAEITAAADDVTASADDAKAAEPAPAEEAAPTEDEAPAEETTKAEEAASTEEATPSKDVTAPEKPATTTNNKKPQAKAAASEPDRRGLLRNRRPAAKSTAGSRWRRKPAGGVAVED